MLPLLPLFHLLRACLGRSAALLLALALAVGLSGCSASRLAYNNAPELAYWWLDNYLDLNEAQSLQVRAELASLQGWHRQHELPFYADTLEQLAQAAQGEVTPTQLCGTWAELKLRLGATLQHAEPAAATLANTLTPAQLDHLARQMIKRQQKWRAQWLDVSPAQRSERRLKQLVERAELFYGPLQEPQLAVARASLLASAFEPSETLLEWQRRQRDIDQTLRRVQRRTPDRARTQASLQALLARSLDPPNAVYRSYVNKMTQENCKTLAALHNSSNSAQRERAAQSFKDYAADARSLLTP